MKKVASLVILAAVAMLAFAASTYPLVISELATKDLKGVSKTTFRRGEVVVVETKLEVNPGYYYAAAPMQYLEIITMWYGTSMLGLTLTRGTIAPGDIKSFGGGMGIRMTDPLGDYKIEVYVWNGFPSEMGTGFAILAARRETTIKVSTGTVATG